MKEQLPSSWCWTNIESLSTVVRGGSPRPAGDPRYFGGPVPWITVGSITADEQPYLRSTVEGLTDAGKEQSRWIAPETLLLTNSGATLGVPKIALIGGCINDGSVALLNVEYPLKLYLYYFLKSQTKRLRTINQGAAQPNLNTGIVKAISVPLAPENEQRRIVAKIDELFSDLDAGVAALKRAKANLKRYRASVLKSAVEGKLTEQLGNYHFKKSNWIEIGTLLTCVEQGWSPKCERESSSSDDEWAVMKTSAVLPMQFLAHENKRLPMNLTPEIQFEVKVGDLLITRAGPRNRAAVTCLVRSSRPRLIVCDKVYRIRCDHSQVIPSYLEIALNSPPILDELDDMKTGISDSGVNLTQQKFRKIMIPIPPLPSQRQIVDEVEERLSVVTLAEKQIEHGLLRAARLRQSILKRAFEGKLVPQDPKDEPASALLERLRASRTIHEGSGNRPSSSIPRRSKSRGKKS
jgi:type I restriction enzyme S subunit